MTSERLSAEERVRASIANGLKVEGDKHGYFIDDVEDALDELAAATAREARLRDMLRESLSAVDFSTYAARTDFFDRARALLAEPDTTSGEEG